MNNIIVIYNANLNKAEIILENLKSIGVNTLDLESELKKIKAGIIYSCFIIFIIY